jgi:hypothetical protein
MLPEALAAARALGAKPVTRDSAIGGFGLVQTVWE